MFRVIENKQLNYNVFSLTIYAPLVAKKCLPGQFVILRVNENGERVPFTIADYDREAGNIRLIIQSVGHTSQLLSSIPSGGNISDIAGPLGRPSNLGEYKNVIIVGGGLGCAIAYPQAKLLTDTNKNVDIIAGFRNKELVILEPEMRSVCKNLHIMTDDGTYGGQGLVTDKLEELILSGKQVDAVFASGPLIMMKYVALLTKKHNIKTIVSMNPIMIDGTGMCGCCRVTVDGKTKFACVDGPDFDGHLVDYDEAIRRSKIYLPQESRARDEHNCRLMNADKGAR